MRMPMLILCLILILIASLILMRIPMLILCLTLISISDERAAPAVHDCAALPQRIRCVSEVYQRRVCGPLGVDAWLTLLLSPPQ